MRTVCCVLTKDRASSRREMPWTLFASTCPRERRYRRNAMELKISIVTCSDTRDLLQDEPELHSRNLSRHRAGRSPHMWSCATTSARLVMPLWKLPMSATPMSCSPAAARGFRCEMCARGDACRLRPRCAGYCRDNPCVLDDQDAPRHALTRYLHATRSYTCRKLSRFYEGRLAKAGRP